MEQDERAIADLSEGEKEQGGEVPVPGGVAGAERGLAREAASSEQEAVSRAGNARSHGAAGSDSDEDEDIEDALTEELEAVAPVGNAGREDASGSAQNEDHEVPGENPARTRFELQGFRPARPAIAHAMPPSSYRRLPLRGRKPANTTRWNVVADSASGGANARDPGTSKAASGPSSSASLGSASATSRPAGLSLMVNASASHGGNNEALGSTARSSELDDTVDTTRSGDRKSGTGAKDAAAAEASSRLPSRRRKQRRPRHFISDPEEAVSAARAKAHRSNTYLDRFLTSPVRTSPPEQRPEWVSNVTVDGVGAQGQRGDNVLRTASGGGLEGPDGSARVLAVAAILGASLALSVVSCVLFYIVGQQTASEPRDSHQNK